MQSNTTIYTVVLDAGHGGADGGVVGINTKVKESDLNLKYTKILGEKLEKVGINVVYTRKNNLALYNVSNGPFKKEDFKRRKSVIISANPDAVISIHMNYFPKAKDRRGAQVFYDKKNANSYPLASYLQDKLNMEINSKINKHYTAISGDYYIINCTKYPVAIVECGFLSNAKDEKLLIDNDYQEEFCYQLFSGIMGYLFTRSTDA